MARGVSDEEVLRVLSRHPECYLLSKDSDFHRKPPVKAALVRHGVGAFIITSHKGKNAEDLVTMITSAWKRMQKFIKNHDRPFVAKILSNGRVEET